MKKKILLTLVIVAIFIFAFAICASAATPSMYVEFGVKLTGNTENTTVYVENTASGNPRVDFNLDFYSDLDFTQKVDKTQIEAIDFSVAYAHGSSKTYVDRMTAATDLTKYQNCKEIKWFSEGFTTTPNNTFKNWTWLEKFDFGCAEIVDYNFLENTGLVEVVLPESLYQLKNSVFYGCTSLERVTVKGALTSVGEQVFYNCTALETVDLGASTKVGNSMFYGCSSLTTISIPSVTEIGNSAFYQCTNLATVSIPSVTKIGNSAFSQCTNLVTVSIPSVTEIGNSTFYKCTKLTDIVFPNTLKKLGSTAFVECTSLTSVHIPAGVTSIGSDCWKKCSGVTSITFDPNCQITHLYAHTFAGTKATTIVLPNTVQHIGQNCFEISTLVSLNLGASFLDFNASNAGQPPILCSSSLKYLYLSDTFTAEAVRNNILNWGDVPSNKNEFKTRYVDLTIFYVGDKDAAEAIVEKAKTGGTDGGLLNEYFASLIIISADDYKKGVEDGTLERGVANNPKRYLVYDYNKCEAFYNNQHKDFTAVANSTCQEECGRCHLTVVKDGAIHTNVFNEEFAGQKYFSTVSILDACEDCGAVVLEKEIAPIFYWVGFSAKTFGEYGFGQQYIINTEALDEYKALMTQYGKTFSYGVVAAGASSQGNPLSVVNGAVAAKAGAEFITFDNVSYDAFFMNITGMTENDLDVALVCCAYVQLGDEVVYLDNNESVSTVTLKSYNQIDAIVNPKEEL